MLIAYGSKNGSTADIAGWIADVLRADGLTADARPVASVGDIGPYDAVVVGAALYFGRWRRDAHRFCRRHRKALRGRPVWLFSSGPLDTTCAERRVPARPRVARVALDVDARDHVTFGGQLGEDTPGFVARWLVAAGKAGDFRDPARVRAWAGTIATQLAREPLPPGPGGRPDPAGEEGLRGGARDTAGPPEPGWWWGWTAPTAPGGPWTRRSPRHGAGTPCWRSSTPGPGPTTIRSPSG
ncbi:flavodoxin domain-containing protein [Streptomyces sp. M19]